MTIQRWAWWANPEDMVMEPNGEYVLYEDHLKAMDELRAKLRGEDDSPKDLPAKEQAVILDESGQCWTLKKWKGAV